jgi:hypothetical protein
LLISLTRYSPSLPAALRAGGGENRILLSRCGCIRVMSQPVKQPSPQFRSSSDQSGSGEPGSSRSCTATLRSLPPCGGGLGGGSIGNTLTSTLYRSTPTPNPSPQGGGEQTKKEAERRQTQVSNLCTSRCGAHCNVRTPVGVPPRLSPGRRWSPRLSVRPQLPETRAERLVLKSRPNRGA